MIRRVIRFLRSVVTGSPDEDEEPCPSLVLLLEAPIDLTRRAALELAEQVWGEPEAQASIARVQHRGRWMIRVSDALFGVRGSGHPYRRRGHETNEVRQRVWDRHRAWLEVEYPDGPKVPESEWPSCYKLLFLMANHLWGERCLGLYLPVQGVTVPNMGDLIASIRWAGNNGTPLPFLHEPVEKEA
ncbi:MAG TPA: hypothetical protein VL990_08815 [Acidobacteriaceae bacterium]|nr:hypothetical protein [Acidobacteriaceae bacterium]